MRYKRYLSIVCYLDVMSTASDAMQITIEVEDYSTEETKDRFEYATVTGINKKEERGYTDVEFSQLLSGSRIPRQCLPSLS